MEYIQSKIKKNVLSLISKWKWVFIKNSLGLTELQQEAKTQGPPAEVALTASDEGSTASLCRGGCYKAGLVIGKRNTQMFNPFPFPSPAAPFSATFCSRCRNLQPRCLTTRALPKEHSARTLQGYTLQLGQLGPSELFQCLNPTDGQSNAWPYIPKSFMKTEGVGF